MHNRVGVVDNHMKTVTVIETSDVTGVPPVQSLLKILLKLGYSVNFIGNNTERLPLDIKSSERFHCFEVGYINREDPLPKRVVERLCMTRDVRKLVRELMAESDILWTTSFPSIRITGKIALKYKNVLELLELTEHGYYFRHYGRFPLGEYARQSWKTVVPEVNRAYIQKAWWDLENTPYVLPNKPFSLDYGELSHEAEEAITTMKRESRKIILYLGAIGKDRELENFASAVHKMPDFVFCIVGRITNSEQRELIGMLQKKYSAMYLGGFDPPMHLAFVQYAHIGLLPYKPYKTNTESSLNAIYCAPNKIFEYAGFGVPMVGTDVPGLMLPFDKWNIGRCCYADKEESIVKAIEEVDHNHDEMRSNCLKYYDSVNLENIVSEIVEDSIC